ncbi:hypothetical protein [Rathayibacter sp. VKM Ac-2926]|uniref:hypothetical protein n=1 Tax=Rathayibacter sp. VKM Ac-2926 TaxID=2929477 RepID=UPI001FB2E26F|nr:hypothetical protein [Rathayibacter sp. VKM Ac-2926]MCJ1705922.1 hypothetical protein [Rathayibacter sp. VKM Ac-2926]
MASATVIPALPFVTSSAPYYGATLEANEPTSCRTTDPDHSDYYSDVTESVWFRYTATARQTLTLQGYVGDNYSAVNAYPAGELAELNRVACVETEFRETNYLQVETGKTYYFQVGVAFGWYSGDPDPATPSDLVHLSITASPPVAGTTVASATAIPSLPASISASNAQVDSNWYTPYDSCSKIEVMSGSVWYRYRAPVTQNVQVDLRQSAPGQAFIVYNSDGANPTYVETCPRPNGETDYEGGTAALDHFTAEANRTYFIQVASSHSSGSAYTLKLAAVSGVFATSVPTVTGTAAVGGELTVEAPAWTPEPSYYRYEWFRNGTRIDYANNATYWPTAEDAGTKLTASVTGSRTGYVSATTTSAPVAVAAPLLTLMPTPTISGTTTVGSTLTANPGTWDAGVTLSYQWKKNGGSYISGATAKTYVLQPADAGTTLTVSVTGTKAGYSPATKTSATTAVVTNAAAITGLTPTITGTATVGQKLTAVAGTWSPAPVTLAYQWKRAGVAITGATASTYTLVAADSGAAVTVSVIGTKSGYASVTKTSAAVTVKAALQTLMPTPTITGTKTVGATLTAQTGTWDAGTTLTYQWKKNGGAYITGATAKTYVLKGSDAGATLTVSVTSTKPGYSPATKTSATTAAIAAGTLTSATPTISGTAAAGQTLTAAPGAWGPSPVTYAYQWKRGTTVISGATGATYTATAADVGASLTVAVTGSKTGYTSVTKSSAAKVITKGTLAAPTPTVTGTKKVGSTLTAVAGTWGPAPVSLSYQWYRSGTLISGATTGTYKLVTADKGKTITVKVTGTKTGYTTTAKTSAATAAIG